MSSRIVVMPSENGRNEKRARTESTQKQNTMNETTKSEQENFRHSNEMELPLSANIQSEPRRNVTGKLRVQVREQEGSAPIEDANVRIYKIGQSETVIREVKTNETGRTPVIELAATNVPSSTSYYRIIVNADGYQEATIHHVDIEPNETMVENIYLSPFNEERDMLHSMETPPPGSVTNEEIPASEDEISDVDNIVPIPNENSNLPSTTGRLRVDVTSILRSRPINGVTVRVYLSGQTQTPLRVETTDQIGRTPIIELSAPNLEYSLTPSAQQPYANYDLQIEVPGFESVEIANIEILPEILAIQNVSLMPLEEAQGESAELFVIPPHTLFGDYPPKIAEAEIKPVGQSGEIVLSRIVVPEYVVVHDGPPSDRSAANYYVKYKDYIKNVASSEIYSTWPEASIIANVLCIQSFCLNRVYTEW